MLKALFTTRDTRANPYSCTISVIMGSLRCTDVCSTWAHVPSELGRSVLLKDTSSATGQAGIRNHILTPPELESDALDGHDTLNKINT